MNRQTVLTRSTLAAALTLAVTGLYGTTAVAAHTASTPTGGAAVSQLHAFGPFTGDNFANADGYFAGENLQQSPLVFDANGTGYGSALEGGPGGTGTIFSIKADGTFTLLHTFQPWIDTSIGSNTDGAMPAHLILGTDGRLYGCTQYGGPEGTGYLFRLNTDGSGYTLLAQAPAQLSRLYGQGPDGNFYGMDKLHDLFMITPDGTVTITATLDPGTSLQVTQFGADGNFYAYDVFTGSAYRLAPGGTTTLMYAASAGSFAVPALVLADGTFYGELRTAGVRPAPDTYTLFKLSPGGDFSALHTFDAASNHKHCGVGVGGWGCHWDSTGINQDGALGPLLILAPDGNFYGGGGAYQDGAGGGATNNGAIWRLAPDGSFSTIYTESGSSYGYGAYGAYSIGPYSMSTLAADGHGNLFVTAWSGGLNATGLIYKVQLDSPLSVSLAFSPATVTLKQTSTLSWSSTGAKSCKLMGGAPGNVPGISGLYSTVTSGSHKVTLYGTHSISPSKFVTGIECIDGNGAKTSAAATLTLQQ